MRYLHTMVRVHNLEASLDFYIKGLGLYELSRQESDKGRFTLVFLGAPEDAPLTTHQGRPSPLLELTYNWPNADGASEVYEGGRNFGHLAYEVEDIYSLCQHLKDLGVVINRPPRDGHMAFVRSPDGISVELLQKGKALAPKDPWASQPNIGVW
jgi:lactoylglutathione lyase